VDEVEALKFDDEDKVSEPLSLRKDEVDVVDLFGEDECESFVRLK